MVFPQGHPPLLLRDAWHAICKRLLPSCDPAALYQFYIVHHYSEPQRHYHKTSHIEAMHDDLCEYLKQQRDTNKATNTSNGDGYGGDGSDATVLITQYLAIFFHDVIYDPRGSDNEEQSAAYLRQFIADMQRMYHASKTTTEDTAAATATAGDDVGGENFLLADGNAAELQRIVDEAVRYIAATKNHWSIPSSSFCPNDEADTNTNTTTSRRDDPLDVFLDLDLTILGTSPERYQAYSAAIRAEYGHFSDSQFRDGRSQFLRAALQRGQLYKTAFFYKLCEAKARENMHRELAALQ